MAKKARATGKIVNRRARFDYELGDSLVVGISLTGAETKALRMGHGNLSGAYVNVLSGELWLVGAMVNSAKGVPVADQERSRKLLAKRSEIDKLIAARQTGRTIVPLEILTDSRFIKLRISIARGKKRYDKRETIKQRQQEKEAKRSLSV